MENALFTEFDMLEQVPTELMTEITEKPETLLNVADHTKINPFDDIPQPGPGNAQNNGPSPFNDQYNTGPGAMPGPAPQKMNAGSLITGQMAVQFLDMALPIICVLLIEKINGKKVNKKSLQATAEEKKILEPVLHNYLMSINFSVDSPLNALLITVAMIYGVKTIEIINDMPQTFAPGKTMQPFTGPARTETRGRKKGVPNKKNR